jgi:cytochrome c-type biogenesis protein CcmH
MTTAFACSAAALVLLALLPLLRTLLLQRPTASTTPDRAALNLAVLRDTHAQLDEDRARGLLSVATYASARQELAQRVSHDVVAAPAPTARADAPHRGTAWTLLVALPLATAALYALTGTPAALQPLPTAPKAEAAPAMTPERIQGMVARLAERMKTQPDDVQGWRMLARSYETLGRFDDAVTAYRQLQRLTPDDGAMLLDYAVTLAMAKGRTLSGEPATLIARVLKLEPDNLQALALAGSEAFERQDYDAAVKHWQAVLDKVPAGTEMAQSVQASIDKARALGGRR